MATDNGEKFVEKKQFQPVGAIQLKSAQCIPSETDSSQGSIQRNESTGQIRIVQKEPQIAQPAPAPAPNRAELQLQGSPNESPIIEPYQESQKKQRMETQDHFVHESVDSIHQGLGASFEENMRIIGSPPLPQPMEQPDFIPGILNKGRFLALIHYGLKGPKNLRAQKESMLTIGAQLAKLKKKQQGQLFALGRAVRVHGLVPDNDVTPQADQAHQERTEKEAAKLRELKRQFMTHKQQYDQLRGLLAEEEKNIALFRRKEHHIKNPTSNLSPEEVDQRVKEYEVTLKQRKAAELKAAKLKDKARALYQPLTHLKDEIEGVQINLDKARIKLSAAENQSRSNRASAHQNKQISSHDIAQVDEETGRSIYKNRERHPSLRQLFMSMDICSHRVNKWEELLNEQQAEIEKYDERKARTGFILLISGLFLLLLTLVAGGEFLRQFLLSME